MNMLKKRGTAIVFVTHFLEQVYAVCDRITVLRNGHFVGEYKTEEGCLSLDGVRPCIRYEEIEVDYLDSNFKPQHGKYSGFTAQIIQHEVDHCNGVVI